MRWRLVAVLAVALTAGCVGLGGETPTETLTPAPVPTDIPDSGPGSTVIPGISADGEMDSTVIAAAHRDALGNQSFVWRSQTDRTGRVGNATTRTGSYEVLVVENATTYYRDTDTEVGREDGSRIYYPQYTEYADGTYRFTRALAFTWDRVRYERKPATERYDRFAKTTSRAVERYLNVASVRVEAMSVDGDRVYRLTGQRAARAWGGSIRNYTVRAHVTAAGFVRNLSARYERVRGTSVERFHHQFSFETVGNVTVERPDWVSEVAGDNGVASLAVKGATQATSGSPRPFRGT